MRTISISDAVVISLALRAEIRRKVDAYRRSVEFSLDCSFYLDELRDLIHAYNALNDVPFDDDIVYLLSNLK